MANTGKKNTPTKQIAQSRPTLKTIASITELGITTVSRALKDAPDIGAATKQRVRDVADQIGYRPNRAGVRLRTGKTHVISLVLDLDEPIVGITTQMVLGVSDTLRSTPYHLIVTPYTHSAGSMEPVRYITETGSADGIIFSRIEPEDERVRYLHEKKIPFATHGRTTMNIEHPFHDFDNQRYVRESVASLVVKKRKRIALLDAPDNLSYHFHANEGFTEGLAQHNLKPFPELAFHVDDKLEVIEQKSLQLFSQKNRPDGIVSLSGGATIALCTGIEAAGLTVGKDVDIVSKQFVDILHRFRPQIVTVNEDIRQAGRDLASALLQSINNVAATELQSISYTAD